MTCLKWLRLLNEPLKKTMRYFYYLEALIWFSPWCFIWVDLAHAYTCLTHTSHHKPLWSFSFWLLMPSYTSLNDVLSLCMIMTIISLLVGRSQSFASPHFVLSISSTRASNSQKTKLFQCVYRTYLLAICSSKVHLTCFYLSFKLNSFGFMWKLVSKALTNLMAHFIFLILKNLTLWLSYVELLCLQVVSWKLDKSCHHGVSFQHCTSYLSWYRDLLFMDTRDVK
jgi:hypothetical protein